MKRNQSKITVLFAVCCLSLVLCAFASASETPAEAVLKTTEEAKPKLAVSLELGEITYRHYCTPCHGMKGNGNGFNAGSLLVKPANHTDAKFMSERTDTKLFDTINLGGVEVAKSTLMPPWGATLGDEKIKSVVHYLRELCQCKATKSW